MSVRKIVKIDEEKCDGCGLCVPACDEGAIQIIDGKARVVNEMFCDGLGACLGECPRGAITIEERQAPDYNQAEVERHLAHLKRKAPELQPLHTGCPGTAVRRFTPPKENIPPPSADSRQSQLGHWPVQLMLVPPHAPFLKNADLLICADCVPFAVPDFHDRYLSGRAVLVGCPKLDDLNLYYEKFKALFVQADPCRITVLKMEVPCCSGIAGAALKARNESAPHIPVDIYTIGVRGGEFSKSVPAGTVA
ncbi:MAG: 4Fe-4S binding protein [candidate division Zixibacteria bacterium]|nr:4Fe-4S binding protein [candidate division Zixibacteria bacterium]